MGYDGVELPIFEMQLEHFQKVGKKLDSLRLERTAVTVCTDTENPISPDAAIRDAGLARLKKAIDMCAASGATHLCGPIHSAIGSFSGSGADGRRMELGQRNAVQSRRLRPEEQRHAGRRISESL